MKAPFSRQVLTELLQHSDAGLRELHKTYYQLPTTQCCRNTHCCSMLPEMTLLDKILEDLPDPLSKTT